MKVIPWIGYYGRMKSAKQALEGAGYTVDMRGNMHCGMGALTQNNYDIMIVQDSVEAGTFELPEGVRPDDPIGRVQAFLGVVRRLERYSESPIIIPHTISAIDRARELEIDANIHLVSMLYADSTTCLVETVGKYLS